MVKTLVIHAGNTENHPDIATLGEKGRFVPEPIEVDVVIQRRALPPRFDDLIQPQHQGTSTRGTLCLAAS
jgi:hypothetical protein